jgi:hypothetical protein
MARFNLLPCQLAAVLLACRIMVSAAPFPMQRSNSKLKGLAAATTEKTGQTGSSAAGPDGKDEGYRFVKHYTLTEPHPAGQSYKSSEYQAKTGHELVLKPKVDEHPSLDFTNEKERRDKAFFKDKTMYEGQWHREQNRHIMGGLALEGITEGHVVRHTGHGRMMLLHHDGISSSDARLRHLNDQVADLYHRSGEPHDLDYKPSTVLWNELRTQRESAPLNKLDRDQMRDKLKQYQANAKKHVKHIEEEPKKLWKSWKGQSVQKIRCAARLGAMHKEEENSSAPTSPASVNSPPKAASDKEA